MTVKSLSFRKAKEDRDPGQNHLIPFACNLTLLIIAPYVEFCISGDNCRSWQDSLYFPNARKRAGPWLTLPWIFQV
jgi:hypothetical protein